MSVYFRCFLRVFLIKHPTSEFEWRFVENLRLFPIRTYLANIELQDAVALRALDSIIVISGETYGKHQPSSHQAFAKKIRGFRV